jgi:hypothetical protein
MTSVYGPPGFIPGQTDVTSGPYFTLESYSPDPVYAGLEVTLSGPNIGVAQTVYISRSVAPASGSTGTVTIMLAASLTTAGSNSATFTWPSTSDTLNDLAGTVYHVYVQGEVNAAEQDSNTLEVYAGPPPVAGTPVAIPPAQYGYGILPGEPSGGYGFTQVFRWQFYDPYDPNPDTATYQFPRNPNAMTTPFPQRNLTLKQVTAIDGQVLLYEGQPTLAQWTFSGDIKDAAHYDLLRSWVYDRKHRIYVTDHFGRQLLVVLTKFDAVPKRGVGVYWRHTYTITGTVIDITEPTIVAGYAG